MDPDPGVPGRFYDRLTPALASVLCQLVDWMRPETLTPEDVAEAYGLRWQVELLFCRLKSTLRLHELPSSKDHNVRGLIWASILAPPLSRLAAAVPPLLYSTEYRATLDTSHA